MYQASLIFSFILLLIAFGTMSFIAPVIGITAHKHRYSSIDGMRAFLALFVFLHHAAIWFYFTHIHQWSHVPSQTYNHFGPTSVALFFMITAFLFFSKLINASSGKIDWAKLYISRVLRIMPLYAMALVILVTIVGFTTQFSLKESLEDLILHIAQWGVFMEPDINKLKGTKFIISGVQWSLAYEWLFYCSLVLIGWLFFRIKTTWKTIVLTAFFLMAFLLIINKYYTLREWARICSFLGGIVTAFLVRNEKVKKILASNWLTFFLCLLLCIVLFYYPTFAGPVPLVCLTIVFAAVACGNTFFGLLTSKVCRLTGQISYSIYLLHGLIIFVVFYFVIGWQQAGQLSVGAYWSIICICDIVLIIICSITYQFVEKPCIDNADAITKKLRNLFKSGRQVAPAELEI